MKLKRYLIGANINGQMDYMIAYDFDIKGKNLQQIAMCQRYAFVSDFAKKRMPDFITELPTSPKELEKYERTLILKLQRAKKK